MQKEIINKLSTLFVQQFDDEPIEISQLPLSGSYREYCRIVGKHRTALGVWNEDVKENDAFIGFSKHFRDKGIKVPEIYSYVKEEGLYLIEDFGDMTLYNFLSSTRDREGFSQSIKDVYLNVVRALPQIQIEGGKGLDYDLCYPRAAFDKQSMVWDLSYFKYYFLKLAKVPFDEQALENDFNKLVDYLLEEDTDYFLYRDFQSRNIMIKDSVVCFIDYQGGRKGALQYDLASLLYDSKADIPQGFREQLVENYLDRLEKFKTVDRTKFKKYFYGYVLIRMMQAMGAYGFRGFYEKKVHFLKSIPYALENLSVVLPKCEFPVELPELTKVLTSLKSAPGLSDYMDAATTLTVKICSFSYKRGLPEDNSGNGGGFLFDCRSVHNPGRYDEYKTLSGLDQEVKDFFLTNSEIENFIYPSTKLVEQTVETYMSRGFTDLFVGFGCTGGQHRSVYCAEKLSQHIQKKYNIRVVLTHREMEYWPTK